MTACLVLSTVVGLGVVGPGQVRPGWAAAWKDPVAIAGATYTAVTVLKPTITGCAVTGVTQKTATITFTAQSTPYAFAYTATLVETGQSVVIGGSGASRQVAFNAGLLSTMLNPDLQRPHHRVAAVPQRVVGVGLGQPTGDDPAPGVGHDVRYRHLSGTARRRPTPALT